MPPNVHAAVATAGARAKDVAVRTGAAIAESAPESVREFGGRVADATLVPAVDGIVSMIELVNDWAVELTDPENVLEFHRKKGHDVSSLADLRDLDLADLDEVVRRLVLQWRSFGAAEGAALGALAMVPVGGGALVITADVVLMQILATAIATRVCYAYGFDAKGRSFNTSCVAWCRARSVSRCRRQRRREARTLPHKLRRAERTGAASFAMTTAS